VLLEEGESLRWASATDQRAQTLETFQERLGKGAVMRAFLECRPAVIRDVATDAQVAEVAGELRHAGIHAALSVPVASLLAHAVGAHAEQALTRQLKLALSHRVLIEQAKGVLMERNRVDGRTAFEHLRAARSSGRRLTVVADQVVATASQPAS
jgi:AmiR/NasT family two-component response regulator